MVDTIILRVNNFVENTVGMNALIDMTSGKMKSDFFIPVQDVYKKSKGKVVYYNAENTHARYYEGWIKVPSSHYTLLYNIDDKRGHVDFNFSIPKYVFGTNIHQFIPHKFDNDLMSEIMWSDNVNENIDEGYYRLMRFIKQFFESMNIGIRWYDVQIMRLDMCFNQIFSSKDEALLVLEQQKRIARKRQTSSTDDMFPFNTSLYYVGEGYSQKIYWKGAEFRNNDKKELIKINEKNGKQKFEIQRLEELADRTLRYETTFRSSWMSDRYRRNIFRKNCSIWQIDMNKLAKYVAYKEKRKEINRANGDVSILESVIKSGYFEGYQLIEVKDLLDRTEIETGKILQKISKQSVKFRLKVTKQDELYNKRTTEPYLNSKYNLRKDVVFCREMYSQMWQFHCDFMHRMEVKGVEDFKTYVSDVEAKLKVQNEYESAMGLKRLKVKGKRISVILELLKVSSLDELVKKGVISRASKSRYKRLLNLIGESGFAVEKPVNWNMSWEIYRTEMALNCGIKN